MRQLDSSTARAQLGSSVMLIMSAELRQTCTRLCTVVFSVLVSGVSQTTGSSDGSVLARSLQGPGTRGRLAIYNLNTWRRRSLCMSLASAWVTMDCVASSSCSAAPCAWVAHRRPPK